MGVNLVRLHLETDAMTDAVNDLRHVEAALIRRHGAPFRALERRIEALFDAPLPDDIVRLHDLAPGRFCAVPAGELSAILAEARRLKVLA
ncbi:MAG: hypothetical protein ACK45V_01700 [Brevundimonas sp.]|jgi:hypothetical protein